MQGCFNPYLGQIWTNPTIKFKSLKVGLEICCRNIYVILVKSLILIAILLNQDNSLCCVHTFNYRNLEEMETRDVIHKVVHDSNFCVSMATFTQQQNTEVTTAFYNRTHTSTFS